MVTHPRISASDSSYRASGTGPESIGSVSIPEALLPAPREAPSQEPMGFAPPTSRSHVAVPGATDQAPAAVDGAHVPSLSRQLLGSKFGVLTKAISVVDGSVRNLPPLPQIVVAREEDAKIVVSCEGHVSRELASRDLILGAVTELMDAETPATEAQSPQYSEKEIVISIFDVAVPTLECVDLPGIRQDTSTGARGITEAIVQSYLEKECIILCVIEGSKGSLSTARALAMVKEQDRCKDTILVFTKADEVVPRNVKPYIVDRILGISDDPELQGTEFAGCFAVVNRCTRWEVSLDAATEFERAQFEDTVFKNSHVLKRDNLPRGCDLVEFERRIQERITIPNLLKCLDDEFSKYIVREWKPRAQNALIMRTLRVREAIKRLGKPVGEMSICAVLGILRKEIRLKSLCDDIRKIGERNPEHSDLQYLDFGSNNSFSQLFKLPMDIGRRQRWGSPEWALRCEKRARNLLEACQKATGDDSFLPPLLSAVDAAFKRDYLISGRKNHINFRRFDTLRALLLEKVVPRLYRDAMEKVGHFAARAGTALMDASYAKAPIPPERLVELQESITGCVLHHLVHLVEKKLALGAGIPDDFCLEENAWYAQRRLKLLEQFAKLGDAKTTIDSID
ncbi:hypothetical protein KFL_000820030 [Klebsormidium nitens]|uniref:Dynamin N-terminal domain-containing protein n=1 Tax=Klebsormidium nitens TaxID=105231 RepID=A0A1Y1HY86_KLENI|nr:hypothetical protein KFL_000820030 [Klebsormidium nitens]|eukprot:GAQ81497.1 hypothetical protein KFL_000820030 [Klebsormidium nitens]